MYNATHITTYEQNEWISIVITEQREILASRSKDPVEILIGVFELFDENFNMSKIKEIKLYDYLIHLCEANKNKSLVSCLQEYFSLLEKLTICFQNNKETIRTFSTELYYALLNFIDLLKRNGIYYSFAINFDFTI